MSDTVSAIGIVLVIGMFFVGLIVGADYQEKKTSGQLSLCRDNSITYDKCAELYRWNLESTQD